MVLKYYEQQLIEGLSDEEAKNLINAINGINRKVGLKPFGHKEKPR